MTLSDRIARSAIDSPTECTERLYNGTQCRRASVGVVTVDYTTDTRPVCKRHLPSRPGMTCARCHLPKSAHTPRRPHAFVPRKDAPR